MADGDVVGVYLIHNPNTDETYVGSGILKKRESKHFCDLENNRHINYRLQRAFNKDPHFEFVPLVMENREEALELEQILIDEYHGNPLFLNLSLDATAPMYGRKHSLEAIEKIREANKGRPGAQHTEETIALIREANAGNTYRLGAFHSQETRGLLSEINRERMKDPKNREKIRETLTGYKHTQEARDNMAINGRRVAETEEGRQKLQRMAELAKQARSRPVVINGIQYESVTAAASANGLSLNATHHRINSTSPKFSGWSYFAGENNASD